MGYDPLWGIISNLEGYRVKKRKPYWTCEGNGPSNLVLICLDKPKLVWRKA